MTIKINGEQLKICSAYFSPNNDLERELQRFESKLPNGNILIGTDSNARAYLWNENRTNNREEKFVKFIYNNNLFICNKGNTSTYNSFNGKSIIDLTLGSANVIQWIKYWHVDEAKSLSDHQYIRYEIEQNIINNNLRDVTISHDINNVNANGHNYALSTMNWSIFKDELMIRVNELRESELNSNEEIDEFVLILTNNLIECCEKSMKIKRKLNRSVPWWTEEIKMMRGEVKSETN